MSACPWSAESRQPSAAPRASRIASFLNLPCRGSASWCRLRGPRIARKVDYFSERYAEARIALVDDDHLAPGDNSSIDEDVHRIADFLVEGNDGAAAQLHQTRDRHRRRAEHDLHRHGN